MLKSNRRVSLEQALVDPGSLEGLSLVEWDLLVRQARHANVLGLLCHLVDRCTPPVRVPAAAQAHLKSADAIARRQVAAVRWEVACLQQDLPGRMVVLLKGAAYLVAGLPASDGRVFADVDILVAPHQLSDTESDLMIAGWQRVTMSDYDQRYYRQWMHEIPPMRHMRRGSVIDVHHAILPPTARIRADSAEMLASAIALQEWSSIRILSPTDMVLHSATHLMHEGEFDHGFRDLVDLDRLLRHFGQAEGFWAGLVPRAREVGLARPLYYALKHAGAILGTPVPSSVKEEADAARPAWPVDRVMDFCLARALAPLHRSRVGRWTPAALGLLYVRSHWLRMPVGLLLAHLCRKFFQRRLLRPAQ